MKSINVRDISDVEAEKVIPGHILAEGIVLEVNQEPMGMYYTTAADGIVVYARLSQTVQVYGRVKPSMVDAIINAQMRTSKAREDHDEARANLMKELGLS